MRVLIVTTWYPTSANPVAGTFVRKDAELLATRHEVEVLHLVAPEHDGDDAPAGGDVPVARVPMSTSDPRSIVRAWGRVAERLDHADVLHTQAFSSLLPFTGRRIRKPWVHSEHWSGIADPSSLTPRGRLVLALAGPSLRRPDVVTTVSAYLGDRVRAFRPHGRIEVVPSVVPAAEIVDPPHDALRPRLVSVGNLVPGKDPLLALDTLRELRRRGILASLTWVGDGPLRSALEGEVGDDEGFTLAGVADAAGVGAALDAADIFLLPTRGETLCLSALEAIAHGRPVAIGANGGPREYVTSANGRLVVPRTAAAYADAVVELWEAAPDPRAIASTTGDRFHASRVLEGYERAYERAAREHGVR